MNLSLKRRHRRNDCSGQENKLINIKAAVNKPVPNKLLSIFESPLEKTLSVKALNEAYEAAAKQAAELMDQEEGSFFEICLKILNLECSVSQEDLAKIPENGPVVFVANHPFGGLEGIVLGHLISKIRPDAKFMGNYLLEHIPEMRDLLVSVNPFGGAVTSNIRPIKEAINFVKSGGALITFPAGEVSHLQLIRRRVLDGHWSNHIGAIIRHSQATVVPIYFPGRNSTLFQILGLLHSRLRTVMLPRELMNKSDGQVKVSIGRPITWKRLSRFESNKSLTEYLRMTTYFMRNRPDLAKPKRALPFKRKKTVVHDEVVAEIPQSEIIRELESLHADALLAEQGDLCVYHASAQQIPKILNEIGRLREVTFRGVQEGTGNAIDLDKFDEYYLHLFLWSKSNQEIVGAYRLGLTDKILEQYGPTGLYSSTLFKYKPCFLEHLGHALEMGRSFIRQEYQRKPQSLPMLWRGIGEFSVRNPQYRVMFGPVSIGQDYQDVSKSLIIEFLKKNNLDSELSRYVKARTPVRQKIPKIDKQAISTCIDNIDDVSVMISEIEEGGRGIPILLRHYLKLSGTLVSFNLDRDFSDAIDGLILVDLDKTEPKLLKRFMGEEGLALFKSYQPQNKVTG